MNKKTQVILAGILTLVAVGLIIFAIYYLISNKDVNKVTTKLESTTSHASQIDKVPVKELETNITLDTLPFSII